MIKHLVAARVERGCDKVFWGRKHHYVPKQVNINIITIHPPPPPPPPQLYSPLQKWWKNNKSVAIIKSNDQCFHLKNDFNLIVNFIEFWFSRECWFRVFCLSNNICVVKKYRALSRDPARYLSVYAWIVISYITPLHKKSSKLDRMMMTEIY